MLVAFEYFAMIATARYVIVAHCPASSTALAKRLIRSACASRNRCAEVTALDHERRYFSARIGEQTDIPVAIAGLESFRNRGSVDASVARLRLPAPAVPPHFTLFQSPPFLSIQASTWTCKMFSNAEVISFCR